MAPLALQAKSRIIRKTVWVMELLPQSLYTYIYSVSLHLKLQCAQKAPGELVKMQVPAPADMVQ